MGNIRPYKPIRKGEYAFIMTIFFCMVIGFIIMAFTSSPAQKCINAHKVYERNSGAYMLNVFKDSNRATNDLLTAYSVVRNNPTCFPASLVEQVNR